MLHNHKRFEVYKEISAPNSLNSNLRYSASRLALNSKTAQTGFTIRKRIWAFLAEQAQRARRNSRRFMWRVAYKSRRRIRRARKAIAERRKQHEERRRKQVPFANPSSMMALEPRIVFDAAAAATVDQTADQVAEQQAASAADNRIAPDNTASDDTASGDDFASVTVTNSGGREIAFVDSALEDVDALLAEIDPSVEVIMLDVTQDGVEQIASTLSGQTNIDAIHILSHGNRGQLTLGTGTLNADTMQGEYADELAVVRDALSDSGDILIYGCDFSGGTQGQAAAQLLADLTGADVAASDDDTGHETLGGDWDLETKIGVIEVQSIQAVNWEQLMAPLVVNQVNGTTITATTLANNIAGAGVTVNSATFAGANSQGGTFTGATGFANEWLGYDTGVVLSTGDVNSTGGAPGGNSSTVQGTAGDADLQALANNTSFDASVLEIDFTPTSNVVTLQFTFGSEEYNEYVYSTFNDAIGVWVNGVHTSVTPTGDAVAIDAVNQAATFNPGFGSQANDPNPANGVFDSANPSLYVNNSTGNFNVEMDGFTVTLTFTANVNVGVSNTIKLGVTDIGDGAFDSWLFVRENSLQTNTLANTDFANTLVNTAVTIDAVANDWDLEGDTLSITHVADQPVTPGGTAVTLGSGATVQLTLGGQLLYTPATGQTGVENFTYTINDGTGSTAVGFVSVDIGVNTAPVIDLNDDGTSAGRNFTTAFTEGGAPVSITANNAGVIDTTDVSFPSLDITLGGFLASGDEILNIGGTDFTFGTAQTSTVHVGGLSAEIVYDGANGFAISNAALGAEMAEADVEALIQSITYDHLGATATTGARTLDFQVSDGALLSNVAVSTINVTGTNDAPIATDNVYSGVTEDDAAAVIGNALTDNTGAGVDSDPEGDTLTVTAQTGVAGSNGGLFSIDAAGVVTFDPNGDFEDLAISATRNTTLTYEISDGNGGTDTATITVTVSGVNDAPTATDNVYNVGEDDASTVIGNALTDDTGAGVDSDPDGDTLTVTAQTGVAGSNGGLFSIDAAGVVTFDPNGDFEDLAASATRNTTLTYEISDGNGGTDTATITVTVSGVNDAPTATDNVYNVGEDDASTVIGNALTDDTGAGVDSDPEGDTLTVTAQTSVAGSNGGLFSIDAAGVVTFDPNGEFEDLAVGATRNTTLTYEISDGNGGTDTATITVTVSGVNDGPTATDNVYNVGEDDASTVIGNALTDDTGAGVDSDPDTGDTLTVTAQTGVAGSAGGVFSINAAGVVTFDPNGDFEDLAAGATRDTTLTYEISDGNGGTDTATITVTVSGVNDAPTATDNVYNVGEDDASTVIGNALTDDTGAGVDSDPEGDTLTVTAQTGVAGSNGGLFSIDAAGVVTFDPNGDFEDLAISATRNTTLTYEISDGNGGTDTATITVTVSGVNDAPTATDNVYNVGEDDASTVIGNALTDDTGAGVDSDPDGDTLTVTAQTGVAGSNGGLFSIDAAGVVTFDPNGDFEDLAASATRNTTLTYEISDGNGGTDTATITVTVSGVNDAPVAVDDSYTVNPLVVSNIDPRVGTGADSDAEGDAISITQIIDPTAPGTPISLVVGTPVTLASGTQVTLKSDGTLDVLTPAGLSPSDAFDYVITDGNLTAQAKITLNVDTDIDGVADVDDIDDDNDGILDALMRGAMQASRPLTSAFSRQFTCNDHLGHERAIQIPVRTSLPMARRYTVTDTSSGMHV